MKKNSDDVSPAASPSDDTGATELKGNSIVSGESIRDQVPKTGDAWAPGRTILDGYIVKKKLGQGGMGTVYLVERPISRSTLSFAVKTLPETALTDEHRRRGFLRELQTWMDLPPDPHITACRFFRSVDNRLAIFSEYVPGGSLDQWIAEGKLISVDLILQIAARIALGLQTAHSRNIIHQDVKPANILMTEDGVPKITDFGLSRARTSTSASIGMKTEDGTLLVTAGGYTPAYCSPEQFNGAKVSYRTDIWSWGLVLLQMFAGKTAWRFGVTAMDALHEVLRNPPGSPIPVIPDALIPILTRCFKTNPWDRWRSMGEVARRLERIHESLCGRPFPLDLTDTKQNSAVSETRGSSSGKRRGGNRYCDPVIWIEKLRYQLPFTVDGLEASVAERNLAPPAISRLIDLELYEETAAACLRTIRQGRDEYRMDTATIFENKGLLHELMFDINGARQSYAEAITVLSAGSGIDDRQLQIKLKRRLADTYVKRCEYAEALVKYDALLPQVQELSALLNPPADIRAELARVLGNKAYALWKTNRFAEAGELFERAFDVIHSDDSRREDPDAEMEKGLVLVNRGLIFWNLNLYDRAMECYDRALCCFERLPETDDYWNRNYEIATVYSNKGLVQLSAERPEEALALIDTALKILTDLLDNKHIHVIRDVIATVTLNRATALAETGRFDEALSTCDRVQSLLETLVYMEGRMDQAAELARLHRTRGYIHALNADVDASIEAYDAAIEMNERMIYREGRSDLTIYLARYIMEKGGVFERMERFNDAAGLYRSAAGLVRSYMDQSGSNDSIVDYALLRYYQAKALNAAGRRADALPPLTESVDILQSETQHSRFGAFRKAFTEAKSLLAGLTSPG